MHAQLHPESGKIVGSVITTEGMKQALLKLLPSSLNQTRTNHVQIFYILFCRLNF